MSILSIDPRSWLDRMRMVSNDHIHARIRELFRKNRLRRIQFIRKLSPPMHADDYAIALFLRSNHIFHQNRNLRIISAPKNIHPPTRIHRLIGRERPRNDPDPNSIHIYIGNGIPRLFRKKSARMTNFLRV